MAGKAVNSFSLDSKNPVTGTTLMQDERIHSKSQHTEGGQVEG